MQDKLVGLFDPFCAKNNKDKMDRMVEAALEKEGMQEENKSLKKLQDLFMGMQLNEFISTDKEEGIKYNEGKPQVSLLFTQFPKALEAVVKCSEYGNQKYRDTDSDFMNFKRVEGGSKTYADAGLRHRLYKKNTTDLDSQLPHSWHIAWNALAELELILENK